MRPTTTAVMDLLASGQPYVYTDCYTFYFVFGSLVAYYTSGPQDLVTIPLDGTLIAQRFLSNSVKVSGAKMKMEVGATVDEQDLQIDCPASEMLDGVPWPLAALQGFFDGCIVRRDRFFAPDWETMYSVAGPYGGAPMFKGRIANMDSIGRQSIKAKVKSFLVLADIMMPRELQGPSCRNTLGDANCTVDLSAFTTAGVCGAGSNASIINWSGASAQYTFGEIQMATGANAGDTRGIKQGTSSQLILDNPFEFEPGVGDAFEATFGCDKTATMCDGTFSNNLLGGNNFRGNRFTPPPETAL